MDFRVFKQAVASQFEKLAAHQLFRVQVERDALWDCYLAAFPEGTNPVFRERREYDCGCCKQFVRSVGDVCAIIDGAVVSLWDLAIPDAAYQAVADALSALVHQHVIDNAFLHTEAIAGKDRDFEQIVDRVQTWHHFFVNIPHQYVEKSVKIGPRLSETRAQHDVLFRSLEEISPEAVETALELIAQNSLYRGEEYRANVQKFQALQTAYRRLPATGRHAFVWATIGQTSGSIAKIRNTAIGTLLVDLSEGLELEQAVRKFEVVMAPQNYKRPTALVTKKMVDAAKETLGELGLLSALERRYAKLDDISINNIIFADRSARKPLTGDVFDSIATKPVSAQAFDRVESIAIDDFITEILPRAESLEVFMDGGHTGHLVSLIAPADPTANRLFKWDNGFSWSYNGDVADSIKERVKQAGGNVTGELLCRLAWSNFDDLDLHMLEPGGYEIFYPVKRMLSPCGGMLDVDMNAGGGTTRTPVENIFYASRAKMKEGQYHLTVHQFSKREGTDIGFEVEFDYLGDMHRFVYANAVRQGERVTVVRFHYSRDKGVEILESLPSTRSSKTVWGVKTNDFHRVNVVMLSPNYWDGHRVGNRHFFFMLDGCANEGEARGFYNEFLTEALTPHRKVIEMVGAKMKTEASPNQLSGLGFSTTQRNELLVRVKGSFTRTLKVQF